ncbi:hypothetical protein ACFE04_017001 [Oxalis oulophora]
MAAGGFVSRAFESMIKECASSRKYHDLQKAIQSYQDNKTEVNHKSAPSDTYKPSPSAGDGSSPEAEGGVVKAVTEPSQSVNIIDTLANAGRTLEGPAVELVLTPLRLAFETKNLKIIEPALDCIHKLIAYDHLEGDPGLDGGRNAPLFTDILNMVCGCVDNSSPDSTILQVLKVLLTVVASSKFRGVSIVSYYNLIPPLNAVHGEQLLAVIRVCNNIALNSKSPINQATSKAMLTQMISVVFRRMETEPGVQDSNSGSKVEETYVNEKATSSGDASNQAKDTIFSSVEELHNLASGADIKGLEAVLDKAVHFEDGKKIIRGIDLESMDTGPRDALLVFRTLCQLAMKQESDEITTKTRILSLELLQGLLEGVSHAFTKDIHFIDSVKAYLSYALLRASISHSPIIFQHATGIFFVLLLRFRESLKGEIGVFFPLVVLRSLDGSECPVNQKTNVLRMLENVCKDPQMLVDMFVNYDCDLEAPNLFERMVTTLSKISQGTQNTDPTSAALSQTTSIKGSSLQCLVNVLKSMVDWERFHRGSGSKSSQLVEKEALTGESIGVNSQGGFPNSLERTKSTVEVEAAVHEFNKEPSKGVEHLITNKLVENTPPSVAHFLRNTPSLDKGMIGDYLGQHEEFPLAVMHAYIDSMEFSGMKFDYAIREFLKEFRLPGEAQRVDHIMEKFAERYCTENPGLFRNADTAYVLAYAVIMLNTDAHNHHNMGWPKMSKLDFVRMNAMNNFEESGPTELLEEIYDSIVNEEIKMNFDITGTLNLALPKRKSSNDTKSESEAIIKQTQAIFQNKKVKKGTLYTSQKIELVRPMVEAVGWPLLATFSVTMEEGDNKPRIVLCMEGFKAGIHITHVLGMDTMRYAFLTSLVRFTFLHSPKEMRSKNVEALRTLLELCDSEPETLQDTWNAVLECVSRLVFIISTPSISSTVMFGSNQISRDAVLQSLRELAGKPVDQVFLNSAKLPSDSVVEFFNALCGVSSEELKQTPARIFSLEKLVEISYYNMPRIRMVWARIWMVLANHFISAGSHYEEKIVLSAIDSLRQLGMKYMERPELTNFTFQNEILKPFVIIMRNSQSETIRSLIVDYIVQMIKSKVVGSIKSGWHSVFMLFTSAADDGLESIVESAFENVEQVILEHFDQVVKYCFMDCVNCLIRFANNKTAHGISLKAVALLRICEDRLAEGLIPSGGLNPIDKARDGTFDVTEHYWFPMLAGLSDLTSDPRPEVRSCALEVLFDLLNERGSKFSSSFWESIFHRVLFPIFDHVRNSGKETSISSDDQWFRETSIHSLQLLCNLFNTFYKEVCLMLPPLLSLLLECAKKTDQTVVSISLGALVHLIEVGGHQFSDNDWDMLLKSIRDASYTTQPLELLNALGFENPNNHVVLKDAEVNASDGANQLDVGETGKASPRANGTGSPSFLDHNQEPAQVNSDGSEGLPSPSKRSQKPAEVENLQRSQTFGQRIMDNIFLRNLTSKSKDRVSDSSAPSSPVKHPATVEEPNVKGEEESPLMGTVRAKCITQLLLLGAIDSIQKKYWNLLKPPQKVSLMDILLSLLEFAASYNSLSNLRMRMNHIPPERPPLNLLRQELVGTTIYLDILQKTTSGFDVDNDLENDNSNELHSLTEHSEAEEKLKGIAENKLVSFCEQVLGEASNIQSSVGETTNMDIHRVLELRSPIIIKVLKGMCFMNNKIFRRHLRELYPLLSKLVCCDQTDIRAALADLFTIQFKALLP